jgi:hypothetical protein
MGYERHNAILVTSWSEPLVAEAQAEASRLFDGIAPVTPVMRTSVNGYHSFAVLPDGSKEGWDHSKKGDEARTELLRWMNERRYSDGSSPLDWVEVQYGDDNDETIVTRHSDEPQYTDVIA